MRLTRSRRTDTDLEPVLEVEMPEGAILSVRDLHVEFPTDDGVVKAVDGVSFDVHENEVLGIVGESGSGKSVTLRALMGLLPAGQTRIEGEASVTGRDIGRLSGKALADFRGRTIAMIFQEPMTALDPVYTIGEQIEETIVRHEGVSRGAARRRSLELLDLVQIPSPPLAVATPTSAAAPSPPPSISWLSTT